MSQVLAQGTCADYTASGHRVSRWGGTTVERIPYTEITRKSEQVPNDAVYNWQRVSSVVKELKLPEYYSNSYNGLYNSIVS